MEGTVTINGTLSAPIYVSLEYAPKIPTDFVGGTPPYEHYKIYTDGSNTVRLKNNAPTAKQVTAQSLAVGATTTITGSTITRDADNDPMNITAIIAAPDAAVVTAALDSGSGTVTLTGVATGSAILVVTVSDRVDTVDVTVPVTVTEVPMAPSIITAALPDGMVNTDYCLMLTSSGDTPINWSLDSGSLPTGLTLSGDGSICGTPTTVGTYHFTVRAYNNIDSDTKDFSIIIHPSVYTITATAGSGGVITPEGNVVVETGTSRTFVFTPNQRYLVSSVFVDGVNQGSIISYTFNTVKTNHTIHVTFQYDGGSTGGGSGGMNNTKTDTSKEKADNDTKDGSTDTGNQPELPTVAEVSATAKVDSKGNAVVTVSYASVADAIEQALEEAKSQGREGSGIALNLYIDLPDTAQSLELTLPQTLLDTMIEAGISQFTINNSLVTLSLDLKALKEIQDQSTGNVTVTINPAKKLSAAAKKLIYSRPAYDITISSGKSKKKVTITSFGNGGIVLHITYTPGKNEAGGGLFGVYMDSKGKTVRMPLSFYDRSRGRLVLSTNHLSVYGIGYEAPAKKYNDIDKHWAKESIEYVSGLGLLEGILGKTFSPDKAITRGMLATLLGRLAEADVSTYKSSSFGDVAKDKYYMAYVEWASEKGIITPIGEGKFGPGKSVTREELALILISFAKTTGYPLPGLREAVSYADQSSIGDLYAEAVKVLQQAGILMGNSSNQFKPKTKVTRAQVCAILYRAIKQSIDPVTAQGLGSERRWWLSVL